MKDLVNPLHLPGKEPVPENRKTSEVKFEIPKNAEEKEKESHSFFFFFFSPQMS
jgi:hypothetical protein